MFLSIVLESAAIFFYIDKSSVSLVSYPRQIFPFLVESVKSSVLPLGYDVWHICIYMYIPHTIMSGNTKFSVHHPIDGSIHSPIALTMMFNVEGERMPVNTDMPVNAAMQIITAMPMFLTSLRLKCTYR